MLGIILTQRQTFLDTQLPAYFVASTSVKVTEGRIRVMLTNKGSNPSHETSAIWTEIWFNRVEYQIVAIVPRSHLCPYPSLLKVWRRGEVILIGTNGVLHIAKFKKNGNIDSVELSGAMIQGFEPHVIFDRYSPRLIKHTDRTGEVYNARIEYTTEAPLKSGVSILSGVWRDIGRVHVN